MALRYSFGGFGMKSVMVVDDSVFMRNSLKAILKANGYNIVAEAGDGREAVTKYRQFKPDMITMDIIMPQFDGIEAIKSLKKLNPEIKVAVVSCVDCRETIIKALTAGAKNFILKPFNVERILEALSKF